MIAWDWPVFLSSLTSPAMVSGALTTILLTATSIAAGTAIGLLAAVLRELDNGVTRFAYGAYTTIIRGTPLLVQLVFVYTGLPAIGIRFSVIQSAILALSVNEGAYLAEIMRAGIGSIHKGQMEAAQALGMTYFQAMRVVILPQAARTVIPPIGNEVNGLLKSTSLVAVISMEDLFRATEELIQQSFRVLELFTVATIYYLTITGLWTVFQRAIEARLSIVPKPAPGRYGAMRRWFDRVAFGSGR